MRACVTGATGFVGGAVVRALVARGIPVRALVRPGSNRRPLAALKNVEIVEGDLGQGKGLAEALRGCDTLFHLAALYSTREEDAQQMYQINVAGTKNILQAARAAGLRRVIHCSTIGTIGQPRTGLATEADDFNQWETSSHYARSKFLAEEIALNMCTGGLPVIVVNPCAPVGAGDLKPSSSGQRILDYLEGRLPRFLAGGINFISIDDVAAGHILAAEQGHVGHRYILGHREGNLTLEQFLTLMERVSGCPRPAEAPPRRRLPFLPALKPARASGGPPPALVCDPSKAIAQLGLPQTPIEQALAESVAWYRSHGYVRAVQAPPFQLRFAALSGD
jgi:dihydroflavonol-4-reductase